MGGSFFIGWSFLQKIKDLEYNVYVLNRGTQNRKYPEGVEHIVCDRNKENELKGTLSKYDVDIVVDFSAFNKSHIMSLLQALETSKIKHYIYISSAAVYLESQIFPIREDFATGRHRLWGRYGMGKLEGERILQEKSESDKFPITIIRPSYVYGPANYVVRRQTLWDIIQYFK